MYKYEMHAHCRECSACANATAVDMVQAFKNAGYAGMVFTDHFIFGNTAIPRNIPWEKRMEYLFYSYIKAIELGKKLDFDVFIGLEHAYGNGKELLVYGEITEEILSGHPEIRYMNVNEFADFAHKQGWFLAQAHPYRDRPYIDMDIEPIPEILDGVEVYNYCNTMEENAQADELAQRHDLVPISGADTHSVNLIGVAGMAFAKRLSSSKDLVKQLKQRSGRMIINGKIINSTTIG